MLNETVETILNGTNELFENLKGVMGKMSGDLSYLRDEVIGIKVEVSHFQGEIWGLKTELPDTPSRHEFNKLEENVEAHIHFF